jgi:hypothetical protein
MNCTIRTLSKIEQAEATLDFRYRHGSVYVASDDFRLKGEEDCMRVRNFMLSSIYAGSNANVVGVRKAYHLGYCRSRRRSLLRVFRRLIQARLDDPKFLKKLRDHNVRVAYQESAVRVRDLEKQLISAKSDRLTVLQEMVANKSLKPQPFVLPLIK